jgi:hypothetical protein
VLYLSSQWVGLFARAVDEKDEWLRAAERHDEQAEDESEVYYVEIGEMQTPTGARAPKRFHLGSSRIRAELLGAVITGIWDRHAHEWTPTALEEVAAAFRADNDELARMAVEQGAERTTEVRIQKVRDEIKTNVRD